MILNHTKKGWKMKKPTDKERIAQLENDLEISKLQTEIKRNDMRILEAKIEVYKEIIQAMIQRMGK